MHNDSNPIIKYRSFQGSYYPFVGGGGGEHTLLLLPSLPLPSLTLSSVILVLPLRETQLLLALFQLLAVLPTLYCLQESYWCS